MAFTSSSANLSLESKMAELDVRRSRDCYTIEPSLNEEQWLEILAKNPILIERPIVVRGDHAIVGRPPEQVRKLL